MSCNGEKCPYEGKCFNSGEELLCMDCDQTEETFKLTDPEEIEKAWNEYVAYCHAAIEDQIRREKLNGV